MSMSHTLTWEAIKYDNEQTMLPKRVRLIVSMPNPRNTMADIIDWIVEPLATRSAIWEATDDLREKYPDLSWEDTGCISLNEQIEAELC